MPYENINTQLLPADITDIQSNIAGLKAKLPFLVNLTPTERQKKGTLSRRKEEYATASYEIALLGTQIIPPVLDMTAWNNDLVLLSQLTTIHRQLAQLQEGLGDTILALRAETALQSNTLFDILKALAKQNTLGADTMVEKLQKLKIKTRNKEK